MQLVEPGGGVQGLAPHLPPAVPPSVARLLVLLVVVPWGIVAPLGLVPWRQALLQESGLVVAE